MRLGGDIDLNLVNPQTTRNCMRRNRSPYAGRHVYNDAILFRRNTPTARVSSLSGITGFHLIGIAIVSRV